MAAAPAEPGRGQHCQAGAEGRRSQRPLQPEGRDRARGRECAPGGDSAARAAKAAKSAETLWLADLEHFETVYSTFNAKKKAIVEEAQLVQAGVIKPIPKKRTYAKKEVKNVITM